MRQSIQDLTGKLDAANNRVAQLIRSRDEAVRGRFEDQERVGMAKNQLAIERDEKTKLASLLKVASDELQQQRDRNGDDLVVRLAEKEAQLIDAKRESIELQAKYEKDHVLIGQLFDERRNLRDQLISSQRGVEDRGSLASQNKYLTSMNHRLRSQVGNFLFGNSRIGFGYYCLQLLCSIPGAGSWFRNASAEVYDHYAAQRSLQKSKR